MQNLNLLGGPILTVHERCSSGRQAGAAQGLSRAPAKQIRGAHGTKVVDEPIERAIGKLCTVDIDHGHGKAGARQEMCKAGGIDSRVDMGTCPASRRIRGQHGFAQPREAVAAGDGPEQEAARLEDQVQGGGGEWKIISRVEKTDAEAKIKAARIKRQRFQVGALPASSRCHQWARVDHRDLSGCQVPRPVQVGASGEQDRWEIPLNGREAVETIFERTIV